MISDKSVDIVVFSMMEYIVVFNVEDVIIVIIVSCKVVFGELNINDVDVLFVCVEFVLWNWKVIVL